MSADARMQGPGLARRLLFWDFPRASLGYDAAVGVILLFIFVTPRDWFRDQPKASSVILMSSGKESNTVFIAPELIIPVPESLRNKRAESLIHERTGKRWHVTRLEAIRDEDEQEIKGFVAYTTR